MRYHQSAGHKLGYSTVRKAVTTIVSLCPEQTHETVNAHINPTHLLSRQRRECRRGATRLWKYLDDIFPKPLFSLCTYDRLVLQKTESETHPRGCVILRNIRTVVAFENSRGQT